jgi:hypothetical protein
MQEVEVEELVPARNSAVEGNGAGNRGQRCSRRRGVARLNGLCNNAMAGGVSQCMAVYIRPDRLAQCDVVLTTACSLPTSPLASSSASVLQT